MQGILRILLAAAAVLFSVPAKADNYPSKPITIIVPFGAGSATDTITRVVGQQLSIALKQTVVVENRPGANGAIAGLYVARAAPDGYTLFMSTNSPHSAVPFLMKNPPYDAVKDFAPITRMGSYTLMLVVHPGVPAHSVKELIEYAKANPGKLSYASGNTSGLVAGATLVPLHRGYDGLEFWQNFRVDAQADASSAAWRSADETLAFEGEHHLMNGRGSDCEESLHVDLGGRSSHD
jgi:putative tricarboxylic transport membrane protein